MNDTCLRCQADLSIDYPVCSTCAPKAHFTNRPDCKCDACAAKPAAVLRLVTLGFRPVLLAAAFASAIPALEDLGFQVVKSDACPICHGTGTVKDYVDTDAPGVGFSVDAPGVGFSVDVPCECQFTTARTITGTGNWCEECFSSGCSHAMPMAA